MHLRKWTKRKKERRKNLASAIIFHLKTDFVTDISHHDRMKANTNNFVEAAFKNFDSIFLGGNVNRRFFWFMSFISHGFWKWNLIFRIDRLATIIIHQFFPFYLNWKLRPKKANEKNVGSVAKGFELWQAGKVQEGQCGFLIDSASQEGIRYQVNHEKKACNCPYFVSTGLLCKHWFAVDLWRQNTGFISEPASKLGRTEKITPRTVKLSPIKGIPKYLALEKPKAEKRKSSPIFNQKKGRKRWVLFSPSCSSFKAKQSKAKQNKAKQTKPKQSKAKQNQKQNKTKRNTTQQHKPTKKKKKKKRKNFSIKLSTIDHLTGHAFKVRPKSEIIAKWVVRAKRRRVMKETMRVSVWMTMRMPMWFFVY